MRGLVVGLRRPCCRSRLLDLKLVAWQAKRHNHAAVQTQPHGHVAVQDIRNIGIIAHVDAGKTTTTERMLYHSGLTKRIGNVDTGNTVTDFLELERERGITIQSAAITFHWPRPADCPLGTTPKTINLIDTPGHQDFRFEVDRCLPVLDGAVCIVDAVKGVEAHTERVWASAAQFRIPRILFVNKLDREGASFRRSVLDAAARLRGVPVLCQIPWWEKETFVGVVDVVGRTAHRWMNDGSRARVDLGGEGELPTSLAVLKEQMELAREKLVEVLAEHDDELMELFADDPSTISARAIRAALRRVVAVGDAAVIPVFAGASFRNIGVEPLMDAVVDYLPSPLERPDVEVHLGGQKTRLADIVGDEHKHHRPEKHHHGSPAAAASRLGAVASVFKVFNHPKEGLLSFVRVYYGELHRHSAAWNTHALAAERPLALLQMAADRADEVSRLSTGQIGALRGLKTARTGDTLLVGTGAAKGHVPEPLRRLQVRPPDVPPAVAFLAIDPYGPVAQRELAALLGDASREDPSLRYSWDDKMEQFVVQGMGRLHLDVAMHELRKRAKGAIDAEFGAIEVDYKECVTAHSGECEAVYDKTVAGKAGVVVCAASVEPWEDGDPRDVDEALSFSRVEVGGNVMHVDFSSEARQGGGGGGWSAEDTRAQLVNGAVAALAVGPRRGRPVQRTRVTLTLTEPPTTPTGGHFSGAANRAVREALRAAHARNGVGVLEPVMRVHITVPAEAAGAVQHDITSSASGQVFEVNDVAGRSESIIASEGGGAGAAGGAVDLSRVYCPPDPYDAQTSLRARKGAQRMVEIVARVPFKEMLDYDGHLRSKTGGRHSMTMEFESFARVTGSREKNL